MDSEIDKLMSADVEEIIIVQGQMIIRQNRRLKELEEKIAQYMKWQAETEIRLRELERKQAILDSTFGDDSELYEDDSDNVYLFESYKEY